MSAATESIKAPVVTRSDGFTPSLQGWIARVGVLVLIFGGILWITATVQGFWADRISLAVIFAIIGLSLNVVLGYVGQVSLGHHGFVGIAAFVAAYYVTSSSCPVETGGCASVPIGSFAVAILLATLSGGVAAGLLGLVALRIRGLYLALITLSYGFVAERSIFEIPELTNGGAGMPAPRPAGFVSDTRFAFLTFAFLALVIFVDWRLIRSKVGRAILSIKHSETVASSYGINVTAYKTMAFVLSGLFAGLAGGLFAFRALTVVSNDFNFANALLWVLMVVVGGLGSRVGVVIGSAFFALFPFLADLITPLDRFVTTTLHRTPAQLTLALGALLAILTIVQFPGGIAEQVSPITRWLGGKRFTMHPEGHGKKGHNPILARFGLHKNNGQSAEPGDTVTLAEQSPDGAASTEEQPAAVGADPSGANGSRSGEEG